MIPWYFLHLISGLHVVRDWERSCLKMNLEMKKTMLINYLMLILSSWTILSLCLNKSTFSNIYDLVDLNFIMNY